AWPSALGGGFDPPEPLNILPRVCAVTPCRNRISVVGVPASGGRQPTSGWPTGLDSVAGLPPSPPEPTVSIREPGPSSRQRLSNASAAVFSARGTQVHASSAGARERACNATARLPPSLTLHRPATR